MNARKRILSKLIWYYYTRGLDYSEIYKKVFGFEVDWKLQNKTYK